MIFFQNSSAWLLLLGTHSSGNLIICPSSFHLLSDGITPKQKDGFGKYHPYMIPLLMIDDRPGDLLKV